jgi:peptidoglycan/LPS O-acetylase OafA/YrhL
VIPNNKPRHIPGIDGLRGLGILMVMAYHYMGFATHRNFFIDWFFAFNRSGWIGVDLFFVVSGFLVTGILLDAKNSPNYFRNFYMRRTLRIFPLYYAVLFCLFCIPLLAHALDTPAFREVASRQIWLWLYGTNILNALHNKPMFAGGWLEANHFWSLAVEEQFYLIWPPIVLLLGRKSLLGVCLSLIAFAAILRIALVMTGHGGLAPYMLTPARLDVLACGAIIAILSRSTISRQTIFRAAKISFAICALFLAIAFCLLHGIQHEQPFVQTIGFSLLAGFFGALVLLVTLLPLNHIAIRALELKPLKSIGRYSYAIYIFHWTLFPLLFERLLPDKWVYAHLRYIPGAIFRYCVFVTISYLLALLSWHAFEKHFLKLKRFFENRPASAASSDVLAARIDEPGLLSPI